MVNKSNDSKSILMLVSSMLIFGTIGIFRRYIPLSSAFLAFARGMIGGLFLLLFIALKKKAPGTKLRGKNLFLLIVTGILIGFNWILLFEAYNHTTVAIATLCYYMQPTIVMVLSPFIFKEKLTKMKTLCALTAVIGMVLVSGVPGGSHTGDVRGVLLGLGAAVLYASVVIINKMTTDVDAYQRTTIQLLSAGLVMIPYLLFTGGFGDQTFTLPAVILLLIVGFIHTGFAYALYFGSMEGLTVQTIAILSYIDPVSALLFSAVFLGEPLSFMGMIGAVMIIGSAAVASSR